MAPDPQQYRSEKDLVRAAWLQGFGNGEHEDLCRIPLCMQERPLTGDWLSQYNRDAQFAFSRVQEHYHQKTKLGKLMPLRSCASKRAPGKCKHKFPKKQRLRWLVVCTGNYKKLHVRISGRRNCLGATIGERSAKDMRYISGTSKAFAVAVNSNTHTGPDYRLPPCAATHDASCTDPACQDALNAASGQVQRKALIRLCKAAQRAARQTAGYFFGYTFKGQPVRKRAL